MKSLIMHGSIDFPNNLIGIPQNARFATDPGHAGSWFGLPDFGLTEWVGSLLGSGTTSQGGSDIIPNAPAPSGGGGGGGGGTPPPTTTGVKGASTSNVPSATTPTTDLNTTIKNAATNQQDAAKAAAEAARQSALRRYNAEVGAANTAKGNATDQYNWLIDTLGSNKKDTLNQIVQNENTSVTNYQGQQEDTQKKYDQARQDILSTYRDLNTQQQKILRGSGQGQSSQSTEAQLRLNTLMGKDLNSLSSQNADALAVIGNAISAVKQKSIDLQNQVETDTKQKLDQAGFDYKAQIDAINANTQLDANQLQDAYDAADAKLQADIANINSWAAGLQVQAAQITAANTNTLNDFITSNVDASGNLTSDLNTAQSKLSGLVTDVSNTSLTQGAQTQAPQTAVFAGNVTKQQLDAMLASGQITQAQYQSQLAQLQGSQQTSVLAAAPTAAPASSGASAPTTPTVPSRQDIAANVNSDPLLAAIFNRAGGATA